MKKELIILAYYINVGGMSRQHVEETILNIIAEQEDMYEDTDKNVKQYYVPITEGQTRIECIYPFNSNINVEQDLVKLYRLLSNINRNDLDEIITNIEDNIYENIQVKIKGE